MEEAKSAYETESVGPGAYKRPDYGDQVLLSLPRGSSVCRDRSQAVRCAAKSKDLEDLDS